jgi:hypothetical protein
MSALYPLDVGDIERENERRPQRRGWLTDRRQGSDGRLAPFGAVYIGLLGLGTFGALLVYVLLIVFVPGASGTRLDAMKTALLVVAGSGAGAGLYVQYRKQQTDDRAALRHQHSEIIPHASDGTVDRLARPSETNHQGGLTPSLWTP